MAEYTLTVKIAEGGTKYINDGKEGSSFAGHMWYSLSDGSENNNSYGFASGENKAKPFGVGDFIKNDDEAYQDTYYTLTKEITKEEYDKLKEFGENPEANGFTGDYNALSNSCVDFTWKALEHAGMNNEQYEGKILPTSNAKEVDKEMYKQMFGSEEGWKETWNEIYKQNKHVVYGDENSNTLTGNDKNEVFYAGKGDDTALGNKGNDTYLYKRGDDNLTIQDNGSDENDRLVIQGFNSEDAIFKLSEDKKDLIITFDEGSVIIKDYQEDGKIEKITFDDKKLSIEDVENKLQERSALQANQTDDKEPTLRELVEIELGRSITDEEIEKGREEFDKFKKEYEQGQTKEQEQNSKENDNDNVVMHMQR
jgi:hypothetical protein